MPCFPGTPGRPFPEPENILPSTSEYEDRPRAWRRERLLKECGFNEQQADVLADTRDSNGNFIYWYDVKLLFIDKGCDREIAFDILSGVLE